MKQQEPFDKTVKSSPKGRWGCFRIFFVCLIVVLFLCSAFLYSQKEAFRLNSTLQAARALNLGLFQYASDHEGKYPEGKSSTEIFQKLLDGNYIGEENGGTNGIMGLLYFPMPGKIKAAPGTKVLKPENLCWDVTCPVDSQASDRLPMIYLTGFRVTYKAGASPVPLAHPPLSWLDWWSGKEYPETFIVVGYKESNELVLRRDSPDQYHAFSNFIPADFDPKGKTYRQLTPDGELPP